jgi:hypothetical protein
LPLIPIMSDTLPTPTCPLCEIDMTFSASSWIPYYDVKTNRPTIQKGTALKQYLCASCGLVQFYAYRPSELDVAALEKGPALLPRRPV